MDGYVRSGILICALSSNVCKISAIGLGWERAFGFNGGEPKDGAINDEKKRWIELDNKGIVSPEWSAFEVFA